MKVVIIGGGKIGYYLSKAMLERGNSVSLIEKDKSVCERIANELDISVVYGDGTTIEMLEAAGTNNADVFIAVSGNDEDNLIACQLAKKRFMAKKTVARSNNPKNVEVMKKMGIDIPVSSTGVITSLIEHEVDISGMKYITSVTEGQAAIYEITIKENSKSHDMLVNALKLPKTCTITAIIRDGKLIIPYGDLKILQGDTVMLLSSASSPKELEKYFI